MRNYFNLRNPIFFKNYNKLTLPVHKISVHLLRMYQQVKHLPRRKLKIHLSNVQQPSKKAAYFSARRHSNSCKTADVISATKAGKK